MISTILGAFRIGEIRNKVLFTAAMLAIYRLGTHLPAPGISSSAANAIQKSLGGSGIFGLLNLFSGGGLGRIAIFALGIMPYITASIILQILQVVVPSLEKLSKEGEVGQARITQYTRYLTVGLAFAQSIGYVFLFRSLEKSSNENLIPNFTLAKVFLIIISLSIADGRFLRVPTARLNEVVQDAIRRHNPTVIRSKPLKIFYATQTRVNPPTFVFFVNDTQGVHFSYERYLENRLRDAFGFAGTAIRLQFRPRSKKEER